jgi:hypothetical protein
MIHFLVENDWQVNNKHPIIGKDHWYLSFNHMMHRKNTSPSFAQPAMWCDVKWMTKPMSPFDSIVGASIEQVSVEINLVCRRWTAPCSVNEKIAYLRVSTMRDSDRLESSRFDVVELLHWWIHRRGMFVKHWGQIRIDWSLKIIADIHGCTSSASWDEHMSIDHHYVDDAIWLLFVLNIFLQLNTCRAKDRCLPMSWSFACHSINCRVGRFIFCRLMKP